MRAESRSRTRNAGAGYCVQDARVVMRSTLLNEHGQDGR
jgi:hypothetical protein